MDGIRMVKGQSFASAQNQGEKEAEQQFVNSIALKMATGGDCGSEIFRNLQKSGVQASDVASLKISNVNFNADNTGSFVAAYFDKDGKQLGAYSVAITKGTDFNSGSYEVKPANEFSNTSQGEQEGYEFVQSNLQGQHSMPGKYVVWKYNPTVPVPQQPMAVTILLDFSGSMSPDEIMNMIKNVKLIELGGDIMVNYLSIGICGEKKRDLGEGETSIEIEGKMHDLSEFADGKVVAPTGGDSDVAGYQMREINGKKELWYLYRQDTGNGKSEQKMQTSLSYGEFLQHMEYDLKSGLRGGTPIWTSMDQAIDVVAALKNKGPLYVITDGEFAELNARGSGVPEYQLSKDEQEKANSILRKCKDNHIQVSFVVTSQHYDSDPVSYGQEDFEQVMGSITSKLAEKNRKTPIISYFYSMYGELDKEGLGFGFSIARKDDDDFGISKVLPTSKVEMTPYDQTWQDNAPKTEHYQSSGYTTSYQDGNVKVSAKPPNNYNVSITETQRDETWGYVPDITASLKSYKYIQIWTDNSASTEGIRNKIEKAADEIEKETGVKVIVKLLGVGTMTNYEKDARGLAPDFDNYPAALSSMYSELLTTNKKDVLNIWIGDGGEVKATDRKNEETDFVFDYAGKKYRASQFYDMYKKAAEKKGWELLFLGTNPCISMTDEQKNDASRDQEPPAYYYTVDMTRRLDGRYLDLYDFLKSPQGQVGVKEVKEMLTNVIGYNTGSIWAPVKSTYKVRYVATDAFGNEKERGTITGNLPDLKSQ